MANKIFLSPQYTVKIREWAIGLYYAVGGAVVGIVQDVLERGDLIFDLPTLRKTAISAASMYLIRTFFKKPSVTTVYDTNDKANVVAKTIAEESKSEVK